MCEKSIASITDASLNLNSTLDVNQCQAGQNNLISASTMATVDNVKS